MIVPVIAGEIAHARGNAGAGRGKLEHAGREAFDEGAVMRDEHDSPVETAERLEEHVLRMKIEMVRRFVEDQEIQRFEEEAKESETAFLAARKDAHLICKCRRPGREKTRACRGDEG